MKQLNHCTEYGIVVATTIVAVPGAKPDNPYCKFHCVSEPPIVHVKSADDPVISTASKSVGVKHDGQLPVPTIESNTAPEPITAPASSETFQVISPGHAPPCPVA